MRATSPRKSTGWVNTLDSTTERYLTSDIHGARSALLDAEALFRGAGSEIHQSSFALAVILAKRSEIEACLGDLEAALSLLDEAVRLFQSEPLGARAGLTTREAVQTFIRKQERVGVKWREAFP
jgi:hypothetical protein